MSNPLSSIPLCTYTPMDTSSNTSTIWSQGELKEATEILSKQASGLSKKAKPYADPVTFCKLITESDTIKLGKNLLEILSLSYEDAKIIFPALKPFLISGKYKQLQEGFIYALDIDNPPNSPGYSKWRAIALNHLVFGVDDRYRTTIFKITDEELKLFFAQIPWTTIYQFSTCGFRFVAEWFTLLYKDALLELNRKSSEDYNRKQFRLSLFSDVIEIRPVLEEKKLILPINMPLSFLADMTLESVYYFLEMLSSREKLMTLTAEQLGQPGDTSVPTTRFLQQVFTSLCYSNSRVRQLEEKTLFSYLTTPISQLAQSVTQWSPAMFKILPSTLLPFFTTEVVDRLTSTQLEVLLYQQSQDSILFFPSRRITLLEDPYYYSYIKKLATKQERCNFLQSPLSTRQIVMYWPIIPIRILEKLCPEEQYIAYNLARRVTLYPSADLSFLDTPFYKGKDYVEFVNKLRGVIANGVSGLESHARKENINYMYKVISIEPFADTTQFGSEQSTDVQGLQEYAVELRMKSLFKQNLGLPHNCLELIAKLG